MIGKVIRDATMIIDRDKRENSNAIRWRILLTRAPTALGPGSWGFEGPGVMQLRVQRGGLLLEMILARCAGASSVGDCRAGTSSIGGAGTSSIGKIDVTKISR